MMPNKDYVRWFSDIVPYRLIDVEAETREDFAVSELSTAQQHRFVLPGLLLRESEWRNCLDALAATAFSAR